MTETIPPVRESAPPPVPVARRRSWWQFSLRSLLIVGTLASVPLGLLAERGRRHRRAVAIVESVLGEVTYDDQSPWWSTPFCRPVRRLQFGWPHPNQQLRDFRFLRDLPEVESLSISHQEAFGDGDLTWIAEMPNLRRLSLVSCNVTDRGLGNLQGLELDWLQIGPLPVFYERHYLSDAELASVALPTLRILRLVFPAGARELSDEQKQLLKRISPQCVVSFDSPATVSSPSP